MCVCYKSSVKKLDLNQETRFTIIQTLSKVFMTPNLYIFLSGFSFSYLRLTFVNFKYRKVDKTKALPTLPSGTLHHKTVYGLNYFPMINQSICQSQSLPPSSNIFWASQEPTLVDPTHDFTLKNITQPYLQKLNSRGM